MWNYGVLASTDYRKCSIELLLLVKFYLHTTGATPPQNLSLFPGFVVVVLSGICSFCFVLFHFCVSAYLCILIVLPLLNSYSPVLSVEVETEIIIFLTWTNQFNMMTILAGFFIEHAKLTVKKRYNRQLHIFHLSFFVINRKQEESNSPSTITITHVHLLLCSLRVSEIIFFMYVVNQH
jgi:hypothetical protein